MTEKNQHAGFIAIAGIPNVGKSTLLNCLAGGKISIVTPKPQTTRQNITCIVEEGDAQAVFVDTPGFLRPEYALQNTMTRNIRRACSDDADVIVLVTEPRAPQEQETRLAAIIKEANVPVYLVVNKTDTANNKEQADEAVRKFSELLTFRKTFLVSAKTGAGIKAMRAELLSALPEHPHYFPKGQWTDRWERFYVAEFIREQIFLQYEQEVPYSCNVEIEEFHETQNRPDHIRAIIHVERDAQKAIIIGKSGSAIKKLREASQKEIESFLDRKVSLELFVKTTPEWRSKKEALEQFGYLK
ncbi:MAG: GTPase Era [Elusimicrobiaceae bacterium]